MPLIKLWVWSHADSYPSRTSYSFGNPQLWHLVPLTEPHNSFFGHSSPCLPYIQPFVSWIAAMIPFTRTMIPLPSLSILSPSRQELKLSLSKHIHHHLTLHSLIYSSYIPHAQQICTVLRNYTGQELETPTSLNKDKWWTCKERRNRVQTCNPVSPDHIVNLWRTWIILWTYSVSGL